MGDHLDKGSRKEALDRWKAEQRAAAHAKLPMPNDQMQALFDMFEAELERRGCNHTLKLTRGWLLEKGLPLERVVAWLHDNGGFGDCETLANAEEAWRDAIKDRKLHLGVSDFLPSG
jgi:hypothetical protein